MLENSVWQQHNNENSFREKLAEFCNLSVIDLIEEDKVLYAKMKAKLTKKELKLFAMDSGDSTDEQMKKEFEITDEELEKAKYKLYKKLKQDKVRLSFKASSLEDYE